MYLVKTPIFIQKLFPNFIWRIPTKEKKLYLSFDDGPIPEITPWVLEQLSNYDAKATFFCVGENIHKYPYLIKRLLDKGHRIGSHTYNHLSGWATDNIPYFHNVRRGASLTKTELFRPPYGRLKPVQAKFLQRHYSIIMWDVLSGDFDPEITEDQCFRNVVQHARPGSIVVFHDSLKSARVLKNVLPRILEHFSNEGYVFDSIPKDLITKSRKRSA